MSRPLLITDCDEVLLHMIGHFADWVAEEHAIRFDLGSGRFVEAMSHEDGGSVEVDTALDLLDRFFAEQRHRQTLVPGAFEALERIGEVAEIVVLTNLVEEAHAWRVEQLAGHGIRHEVVCNRGGKGAAVRAIVDRYRPSAVVFVDDLETHHQSAAQHAPETLRLQMIAEPRVASVMRRAPDAHARIDDWESACDWVLAQFEEAK